MSTTIAKLIDGRKIEKLANPPDENIYKLVEVSNTADGERWSFVEIVNVVDVIYYENLYAVSLDYFITFYAFANNPQEAIEEVGKYCKDKNYDGLFVNVYDMSNDFFNERYTPINGGEYYLAMPISVKELKIAEVY